MAMNEKSEYKGLEIYIHKQRVRITGVSPKDRQLYEGRIVGGDMDGQRILIGKAWVTRLARKQQQQEGQNDDTTE